SSLSKVFSDEELMDSPVKTGSALWKETYSFQVAYKWGGDRPTNMFVEVASELSPFIQIRSVGLVPSEFPIYCDHDKDILRATPGLYPDPLHAAVDGEVTAFHNQWRSVWITVE